MNVYTLQSTTNQSVQLEPARNDTTSRHKLSNGQVPEQFPDQALYHKNVTRSTSRRQSFQPNGYFTHPPSTTKLTLKDIMDRKKHQRNRGSSTKSQQKWIDNPNIHSHHHTGDRERHRSPHQNVHRYRQQSKNMQKNNLLAPAKGKSNGRASSSKKCVKDTKEPKSPLLERPGVGSSHIMQKLHHPVSPSLIDGHSHIYTAVVSCDDYYNMTSTFKPTEDHALNYRERAKYVALDCEMVGVGPFGEKSVLARICVIDWNNTILLDTYVKVDEPVTDYRTFVSGVRSKDINSDSAMSFDTCQHIVTNLLRNKILIGHALENDLKVLGISHPASMMRDTAKYPPFMAATLISPTTNQSSTVQSTTQMQMMNLILPDLNESDCASSVSTATSSTTMSSFNGGVDEMAFRSSSPSPSSSGVQKERKASPRMALRPRKLRELAREHLGLCIQKLGEQHSPLEDAKAALDLYKHSKDHWETLYQ